MVVEDYLKETMEDIREKLFSAFGDIGVISMTVGYDYIHVHSQKKNDEGKRYIDFHTFYNADGTDRYGKGEDK